jgi:hypothetical protein
MEEHGQYGDGDQDGRDRRAPAHREVVVQVLEVVEGQQVGQVGDRQEERGGAGQPDRGEGEQLRRDVELPCHREYHRRQQHRAGVE